MKANILKRILIYVYFRDCEMDLLANGRNDGVNDGGWSGESRRRNRSFRNAVNLSNISKMATGRITIISRAISPNFMELIYSPTAFVQAINEDQQYFEFDEENYSPAVVIVSAHLSIREEIRGAVCKGYNIMLRELNYQPSFKQKSTQPIGIQLGNAVEGHHMENNTSYLSIRPISDDSRVHTIEYNL